MSWLRNLQGQLTEFTSELLNEATEEVDDPESELQVSNKKCLELEQLLSFEVAKNSKLEAKVNSLIEVNLSRENDISTLNEKFENIIRGREEEIRRLKNELEQNWSFSDDRDDDEQADLDYLRKNDGYMHGVSQPTLTASISLLEYESKLQGLQIIKEREIAALVAQHAHLLSEMKDVYEDRITSLQGAASSSTSNVDLLDAVLLEKEELIEAKRKLEEMVKDRISDDQPVIVNVNDNGLFDELRDKLECLQIQLDEANTTIAQQKVVNDSLVAQNDADDSQAISESELDQLKLQNMELTAAYNELDEDFEKFKMENSSVSTDNSNLSRRIDCLKASLVEYEERYELCKRENSESLRQIESLTSDFERLKIALEQASTANVDQENDVTESILQLRNSLDQSDADRRALKEDVVRFREVLRSVEDELNPLRELNTQLVNDNESLRNTIVLLNSTISASLLESQHATETTELISSLKTESEALRSQISALQDSMRCQGEMNLLLNQSVTEEKEKNRLLVQKNDLLEELKKELDPAMKSVELEAMESLNIQLKEALLATTEKTDECERLRQRIEELEKELSARQSCVDDLIIQNNLLQVEYQNAADQTNDFRKSLNEKEQQFLELERQTIYTRDWEARLRTVSLSYVNDATIDDDIVTIVTNILSDLSGQVTQFTRELMEKREFYEDLEAARADTTDVTALNSELNTLQQQIKSTADENETLKEIASKKHQECLEFYEKLNNAVHRIAELEQLTQSQNVAHQEERSSSEKRTKELQRLKEHLLLIEETSTKEAVDAERRETELRKKLHDLQQQSQSITEGATETNSHQQMEIRDLRVQLETAQNLHKEQKAKYESEKILNAETTAALNSLQVVVRELSIDHEKDSAAASHRSMELQDEVKKLSIKIVALSEDIEKVGLDKQVAEENADLLRSALLARQKIIDDLELQLEDSRVQKEKSSDSYRIDDTTLRNLFMSYFTASRDKQPDIALLLANILEYSQSDIDKIRLAVRIGSNKEKSEINSSIAEQFIRFLEKESESSSTAPQLPVDHEKGQMTEDRPLPSHSSASALRDILK